MIGDRALYAGWNLAAEALAASVEGWVGREPLDTGGQARGGVSQHGDRNS